MGHATASRGQGLIYAMEVSEVLDFDAYYNDPRFERKKPRLDHTWREACGDNIYYLAEDDVWAQHLPTLFHGDRYSLVQDTRHPRVFVSEHFYYFGGNATTIPQQFATLIRDRQGCKCSYPKELAEAFVRWLQVNFEPGIHGEPRDLGEWVNMVPGSHDRNLYPLGRKPG